MDVSTYMAKVYPSPPCWLLVSEVYANELGQPVNTCRTVTDSIRAIASAFRLELHKGQHGFQQIAEPADFAVVLMGTKGLLGFHHCGIYYQGKVLHAQDTGTLYQDLPSLQGEYDLIEYWAKS